MRRGLKRDRFPYRWLTTIAPLHALKVVQYESAMAWVRLRHPRNDHRFVGASDLLVNVGCGRNGMAGWVNVDSSDAPGVTCIYDCRRRIPLPSRSAKAIFTEHLLEHLDYEEEAPVLLAECRRVLRPGGVIRIVVPDGRKYLTTYLNGGWDEMRSFSPLAANKDPNRQTLMEVVNQHFRQAGQHRFSYDYETLASLLDRSGFHAVAQARFGDSRMKDLAIDSLQRAPESLYVEAVRAD